MLASLILAVLLTLSFFGTACAQTAPSREGAQCLERISDADADAIGKKIWQFESGGKLLIWWDDTCDCPSMGINNYLWFPPGHQAPFQESFLAMLDHMKSRGVDLPEALRSHPDAPWRTPAEMFAEVVTLDRISSKPPADWKMTPEMFAKEDSPRASTLKGFLARTVQDQVRFSAQRAVDSLPKMLTAVPEPERAQIERQFYRVACARGGLFNLVDYVNFKGEGVNPKERYPDREGRMLGWGLLQVLQGMLGDAPGQGALDEFADSAARVITRRVDNAPLDRVEKERKTWLPIWLRRIQSYRGG